MAKITTLWELRKPFGQTGLELWTFADGGDDGGTLYDISGKGRNLQVASSGYGIYSNTTYKNNNQPTFIFDGSSGDPLKYTGSLTLKHIFIVAFADGTTFSTTRGLLSGIGANPILSGHGAEPNFIGYDYGETYKKSDVAYAVAPGMPAPMGAPAIIELIFPSGITLDGIQIGQELGNTATKWKGGFNELICFSVRKGYFSRMEIYRYLAEKYFLFRETSDGKKIFPFPNNHASPFSPLRYRIQSPALPNGKIKSRIKGSLLEQFEYSNDVRRQTEIDAVRYFEKNYFDGETITVENNSFYPPRLHNIVPTSDISKDPNSINLWGYKWTGRQADTTETVVSVDADEVPLVTIPYYTIGGNYITLGGNRLGV